VNNYYANEITNNPAYRGSIKSVGNVLTTACHGLAKESGWWNDLKTGEDLTSPMFGVHGNPESLKINVPEKLMLIVSEVSEGMEGHRKNLMDDKLPHRMMLEVELADAVIRIFDLAGGIGLDVAGAIVEKLAFNAQRADHKPENRRQEGGKGF
jgi:hypothetical protein